MLNVENVLFIILYQTEIQRITTVKASTPPPTTSSTTVPTTTTRQTTTTTTTAATTTTASTTQRPVYVVEQSPIDTILNQQMKISVKSNILNGEDIVGTKVEKMFAGGDDPWWNAHQNELQVETGYKETPYQEQKWYNPVDPVHAPWVTIPPDKSTPMAWRTYAPTTPNYQSYTNVPGENGHTDPSHWSGGYRNPLLPIKLFSIDMPIKIYHYTNRHQFIPRQSTTRKKVYPTSTTTVLTTTTVTTRKPEVHTQLPVRPVSNPDKIEEERKFFLSLYFIIIHLFLTMITNFKPYPEILFSDFNNFAAFSNITVFLIYLYLKSLMSFPCRQKPTWHCS